MIVIIIIMPILFIFMYFFICKKVIFVWIIKFSFIVASRPLIKIIKRDGPFATSEGSDAFYSVSLQTQPTDEVVISLEPTDELALLSTNQLTFNTTNWNISQEVAVSGAPDNIIRESPYAVFIRLTTESNDADFGFFDAVSSRGIRPVNFGVLLSNSDIGINRYICINKYIYIRL